MSAWRSVRDFNDWVRMIPKRVVLIARRRESATANDNGSHPGNTILSRGTDI